MKATGDIVRNLSDQEQRLLLTVALLPPPISLDSLTALSTLSPVHILQFMEKLSKKRVLQKHDPSGPGYYQLINADNSTTILTKFDSKLISETANELINLVDNLDMDATKRTLTVANIYRFSRIKIRDSSPLLKAAEHYLKNGSLEEASTLFELALDSVPTMSNTQQEKTIFIDAALGLISSFGHRTSFARQRQMLSKARQIAEELHDQMRLCRLDLRLAKIARDEGDYQEAAKLTEEAWDLAKSLSSDELLKRAAFVTSELLFWQGRVAEAVERYEEILGNLEEIASDQDTLIACATLGWCYGICGQTARGMSLIDAVRNKAREQDSFRVKVYADLMSLLTLLEVRRLQEAEFYLDKIFSYPEQEVGNYVLWAAYSAKAFLLKNANDLDVCYEFLKKSYAKSKEIGWSHHRGPWCFEFLNALEEAGKVHPKWNYDSELKRISKWPDVYMQGVGLRYRAQRLFNKKGGIRQVQDDLLKSQKLLVKAGAKVELARNQIFLAKCFVAQGMEKKAGTLLQEAWSVLSAVNPDLFPDELHFYLDKDIQETFFVNTLLEVGKTIGTVRDRQRLLERIINLLMKLTRAGRGGFFLENINGQLELVASRNLELKTIKSTQFEFGNKIISHVVKTKQEIVKEWQDASKATTKKSDAGWALCSPIILGDKLIGVIYLDNTLVGALPPKKTISLLRVANNQVAVALDNAKAYEEIAHLKDRLEEETRIYRNEMEPVIGSRTIIGESAGIKKVLAQTKKVAPTETTVLIHGETGVGKEVVAREVQRLSKRMAGPFIPVNLATLTSGLIASELFGHQKGAFTGATQMRRGRFELAHGGTLLLDDIDTLSLDIQPQILRALQEKKFERVGGTETIHSDFRLIATTNQNLEELVKRNLFRADLLYRLMVFPIHIPPLRKRKKDIPLLVLHFLKQFSNKLGVSMKKIRTRDMEKLKSYPWPGNVRELKHIIERGVILGEGDMFMLPDLSHHTDAQAPPEIFLTMKEMEKKHTLEALKNCSWKVSGKGGAAELLDMKPTTLFARIRKLGIKKEARYT